MSTWKVDEAIKLTVCGAVNCMGRCLTICLHDSARKKREIKKIKEMLSRSVKINAVSLIDKSIKPYDYIRWALTKKTISLPQEMTAWYNGQPRQKTVRPSVAATAISSSIKLEEQLTGKDTKTTRHKKKPEGQGSLFATETLSAPLPQNTTASVPEAKKASPRGEISRGTATGTLRAAGAAKYLSIAKSTFYRLIAAKRLPLGSYLAGSKVRVWTIADLDDVIAKGRQ